MFEDKNWLVCEGFFYFPSGKNNNLYPEESFKRVPLTKNNYHLTDTKNALIIFREELILDDKRYVRLRLKNGKTLVCRIEDLK